MAISTNVPFEIILADDKSCEAIRIKNRVLNTLPSCKIIELEKNCGPAVVRNILGEQAQYPYLLFIDADTRPVNNDFLSVYLAHAGAYLICGGFSYLPQKEHALRYKYGTKVEMQSAETRNRHPYQHFISMNFFLPKTLFLQVRFDETFHFGYEDADFGRRLKKCGILIQHIENPVWHKVEENSIAFLDKTRRSVENLSQHREQLIPYVRLLRWHCTLERFHLVTPTAFLFRLFRPVIERILISKYPNLSLFAFYKLGYLCQLSSL